MESLLLSVHVVAGILFVGPVAAAASLFPRYAGPSPDVAALLHRITRGYGAVALVVPLVGLGLAMLQGRTSEVWVVVAMALTAVAGGLLALQVAPRQAELLSTPYDAITDTLTGRAGALRTLGALTGLFNLLWAAVVVLMIVRPGSVPR